VFLRKAVLHEFLFDEYNYIPRYIDINNTTPSTLDIGLSELLQVCSRQRVWLVNVAILFIVFALDISQARTSIVFTLDALTQTTPFLVFSIAIAAYASASSADTLISKAFSGSP